MESFKVRAHGSAGQRHAAFVSRLDLVNECLHSAPDHRAGPLQRRHDRVEERTAPVLFQDSSTRFDRVVFTVVRRKVHEFDFQPGLICELHQALQELRPRTADLRAVIQFDHQSPHTLLTLST